VIWKRLEKMDSEKRMSLGYHRGSGDRSGTKRRARLKHAHQMRTL